MEKVSESEIWYNNTHLYGEVVCEIVSKKNSPQKKMIFTPNQPFPELITNFKHKTTSFLSNSNTNTYDTSSEETNNQDFPNKRNLSLTNLPHLLDSYSTLMDDLNAEKLGSTAPKATTFTDLISIINGAKTKKLSNRKYKVTESFVAEYMAKLSTMTLLHDVSPFIQSNKIIFPYPEKVGLGKGKKRVLFLDIDRVLLKCAFADYSESDHIIQIQLPTTVTLNVGVTLRPNVREILEKLKRNFFLCIYSTCDQILGDALIDYLDYNHSLFTLKLYRNKCHRFKIAHQNVYVKDLRIIQGVPFKDIVIVDSHAFSSGLQLSHVIPITEYNSHKTDEELKTFVSVLDVISNKDDMRNSIENRFLFGRGKLKASTVQLSQAPQGLFSDEK